LIVEMVNIENYIGDGTFIFCKILFISG